MGALGRRLWKAEVIKEVVSISIGSAKRDHAVDIELLGEEFRISREGTDGDMARAQARFTELDGKVAAFGMGGIDLSLRAAGGTYRFRSAKQLVKGVKRTPVLDGTGLKGAVEGSTVAYMQRELGIDFAGKKVLLTSAVDRWGLAEALHDAGCDMVFGDFIYALGLPIPIRSWRALRVIIRIIAPIVVQLPYSWLYPTGSEQEKAPRRDPKTERLYEWADIIAGDWQFVRKFMPEDMQGKWVITNTTTAEDVAFMRARGIELLVTSTPRLNGRSFGTNVIEATMVALAGASAELPQQEYQRLLTAVGFAPDVRWLQRES
jgi:hypothetical protein